MSVEELPRWWFKPQHPWEWEGERCVNPSEAESSVDVVTFTGVAHVYLFLWEKREGEKRVYEKWYIVTYRNNWYDDCDVVYGYGRTLDEALAKAELKWDAEFRQALNALGVDDETFYGEFCVDCEFEPWQHQECTYCYYPFEEFEDKEEEVEKTLQDLSPTIQDLKRRGMESQVV